MECFDVCLAVFYCCLLGDFLLQCLFDLAVVVLVICLSCSVCCVVMFDDFELCCWFSCLDCWFAGWAIAGRLICCCWM